MCERYALSKSNNEVYDNRKEIGKYRETNELFVRDGYLDISCQQLRQSHFKLS